MGVNVFQGAPSTFLNEIQKNYGPVVGFTTQGASSASTFVKEEQAQLFMQ